MSKVRDDARYNKLIMYVMYLEYNDSNPKTPFVQKKQHRVNCSEIFYRIAPAH
jgi:hypothetical protein